MIGQAVSYVHSVYLYRGETPYGPFTDQKFCLMSLMLWIR